jgi:hypothetical protein
MDNETAVKLGGKIGKTIKYIAYTFIVYSVINFTGILIGNEISINNSPKIKDVYDLEILLRQEKKKLGIEDKMISVSFNDTIETSYSIKENGRYKVFLCKRHHNLGVLTHELWHVKAGHLDRNKTSLFRKYYLEEPSATIYSLRNIKLHKN